jgi:hypothetical protein
MHQSPARGFPTPVLNTQGSRPEGRDGSEDPPQADRSPTRVRIAKRGGDAGETGRALECDTSLNPKTPGRSKEPAGVDPERARKPTERSELRAPGAEDDGVERPRCTRARRLFREPGSSSGAGGSRSGASSQPHGAMRAPPRSSEGRRVERARRTRARPL